MKDISESSLGREHEPGIVEYSVISTEKINGNRGIVAEGILQSKDKTWVSKLATVNKHIRSILKYHTIKGDRPFCCVFYIHTEDGVSLCRMAYDPDDRRMN